MKAREELLRDIGALRREAEYWELEAKDLLVQNNQLKKDLHIAKSELKLWMGTGV
jgi:flagellar biosynthesis regulator FlaF